MNELSKFIGGIFIGFLLAGFLITILVTNPRKEEAIKRGYAEMKLKTPYDTESVFTWKEPK
jgi:hypothetical protein